MLKVNEIFYSIQGESSYAGCPCVFIRLSGCNLRCTYCDTEYAYDEGNLMLVDSVVARIRGYNCPLVEITGGEPLLQEETSSLVQNLVDSGFQVLVETNGTRNIDPISKKAVRIVDIKCPGSGESERVDWCNLDRLVEHDEVKFVLVSRSDYDWAKQIIEKYRLERRGNILLSPLIGRIPPNELADWMLKDKLYARLQLQVHKIIWQNQKRGK